MSGHLESKYLLDGEGRQIQPATRAQLAKRLGANLKFLRTHANLSQGDLAKKVNIDRGQICRYESGQKLPDPVSIYHLARVLDCSLDDLLDE